MRAKKPPKSKERDYATLHDKAVKRFNRAKTIPFWAAALNLVGTIYYLIMVLNTQSSIYPSRFIMSGFNELLTLLAWTSIAREGLIALMVILAFIVAVGYILIGYFAMRPPRKKIIILSLIVMSIALLSALTYHVVFLIAILSSGGDLSSPLQDAGVNLIVHGVILFFAIDCLLQYNRVISLEKEFHGKNITITETKIVTEEEIKKEKGEKDYDFLKK